MQQTGFWFIGSIWVRYGCSLYVARMQQTERKLAYIHAETSQDYLSQLESLQTEMKVRQQVAEILNKLRIKNLENLLTAEQQAAQQNYQVSFYNITMWGFGALHFYNTTMLWLVWIWSIAFLQYVYNHAQIGVDLECITFLLYNHAQIGVALDCISFVVGF